MFGFYSIASLTAIERLINNEYWFKDILFGALIGITVEMIIINEETKKDCVIKSKLSV